MISMGGEGAGKGNPRCKGEGREVWRDEFTLVFVIYRDHQLFINVDHENTEGSIRVAIGWLVYQDSNEIVILMDRSFNPQPSERNSRSSGLRIIRSNILYISDVPKSMLDKLTSDFNLDRYTKKQVNEK